MATKLLNRKSLKAFFSAGSRPRESNFSSLIDSMVNKLEDGISKTPEDGLILAPEGQESEKVLSFFDSVEDNLPQWSVTLNSKEANGLSFTTPLPSGDEATVVHLEKTGNVGIGNTNPLVNLDVSGIAGSHARIGTYKLATVPGDGRWHDILTGLDGCAAVEIVAQVGKEKSGKYALLHATALSTFGRSMHRIRRTQAHYGWFWNKIAIRFRGSTYNYSIQLKTRSDYGKGNNIRFHITKLWDNDIMNLIK